MFEEIDGEASNGSERRPTTWQALYHAALFETDRHKVPLRIAEAESAVLVRIKEQFS